MELVNDMYEGVNCEYGLNPYVNSHINVLNPCFLSLVSLLEASLFIVVGIIQLRSLYVEDKVPENFKLNTSYKSVSLKHKLHIGNVFLQILLVFIQLFISINQPTPRMTQWNFIANFVYVSLVNLPTVYISYFKSTCAIGNSLIYYFLSTLSLGFCVIQRWAYYPNKDFNVLHGGLAATLEILSLINGFIIFIYELCWYQPSNELIAYFEEKKMFLSVNIFSGVTFTWMNDLIMKTYKLKKIDDPHNMSVPTCSLTVREATEKLQKNWEIQKWKDDNSLSKAILYSFGGTICIAIFLEIIKNLLSVIQPQLLRWFILTFSENQENGLPPINGVFLSLALFLVNFLSTVLSNQSLITIFDAGSHIRAGLMSMIYEKALRLSIHSREQKSVGDILNLMSVDVFRIQKFFENSDTMIGAPIQLVVVLISLYFLLGRAMIGGLITMAIMIPINSYLSKKVKTLYKTQMKYKDMRIKTITEILNSIKSIKFYGWEEPMLDRLHYVRNSLELKNFKKISIISNFILFAWNCVPIMVTCSTFAIFSIISDIPLSPQIVFPSLTLFNLLTNCIYSIPTTIVSFIETGVSLNRLRDFLLLEELDDSFIQKQNLPNDDTPVVEINNATFLWESPKNLKESQTYDEESAITSTRIALKNLDYFEAKKGQLTCIVGRVGSGKSTFLSALLGQLPCISGSLDKVPPKLIFRAKSVAFCPQQPWIMNTTLKENIVFGHKWDESFYNATVKACELLPDLEILPDNDETLVGEKGISLSGGQKARLSLARAVYSRSDVYLFDDILSAVDSHVSKNLITQVLDNKTGLLRNKTVILATNAIQVLKHSDNIYALKHGRIVEKGSYKDIKTRNSDSVLKNLIEEFDSTAYKSESNMSNELKTDTDNKSISSETSNSASENILAIDNLKSSDSLNEDSVANQLCSRKASIATFKPQKIVNIKKDSNKTSQQEESRAEGRVKMSIYLTYIKACGVFGVCLFFIFMILSKIFELCDGFWLKYWSESNEKTGSNEYIWMYVGIYALIGIGSAGLKVLKSIVMLMYCSVRASQKLHDAMAFSILRSPMSFFETTPLGRIINRFSTDINAIDEGLQNIFSFFFNSLLSYVVTVILIGFNIPWFFVFNLGLLAIYYYYQVHFMVLSRELKRLVSISNSPIMSLLSESLNGHSVLNAYNQLERFKFLNYENIQFSINCMFIFRSINRWLSIRLQTIGSLIVLATAFMSLNTLRTNKAMTSGMVGLLMSYALDVTDSLMWIIRMAVRIEINIVSVERIVEYCDLIPEAPSIIESNRPKNWPLIGSIEFNNYSTKYRDNLDPVLKDITVSIKPKEKIGIVGRTGAGKSTLTLSLFRLLEAATGSIIIDGIDISKIGLSDLRRNLAIIPQDAQAFEGTIRANLDPFNQHTDEEIWKVLELSHLRPHIEKIARATDNETQYENNTRDLLRTRISENGNNLSVGQKQLLCLSRALLNKSKILVLDEATAAVDMETDKIIQKTIRTAFKDRTILTIAHRIDTVLDSDKIMVLDKGELKEFDSPSNLLANSSTIFYSLCEKGGYLK